MSGRGKGEPATSDVSRSFQLANEIGEIKGLLLGILGHQKDNHLETVDLHEGLHEYINLLDTKAVTMSAKNKLRFSGRADEEVSDFILGLEHLSLANNWSEKCRYGNLLCSLTGEALLWYNSQDVATFKREGELSFLY